MRRFELLKDLPNCEIGSVFNFSFKNNWCHYVTIGKNGKEVTYDQSIVENPSNQSWFREIKEEPKEEFVWTDALVVEFTTWSIYSSPTFQGRYEDVEEFKKRKQSKSSSLPKQYLFTTEDGEKVFEGDRVWFVDGNIEIDFYDFIDNKIGDRERDLKHYPERYKYFSTEELAKEYVKKVSLPKQESELKFMRVKGGDEFSFPPKPKPEFYEYNPQPTEDKMHFNETKDPPKEFLKSGMFFPNSEDKSRDWEVVKLICSLPPNNLFIKNELGYWGVCGHEWSGRSTTETMLSCGYYDIHSVKRLSDSQVFSVGDEVSAKHVSKTRIRLFNIVHGNMMVECGNDYCDLYWLGQINK